MNKKCAYEIGFLTVIQATNALFSHFAYVAIATTAYLFKLAIAATLAAYSAFLCATIVGGLTIYFTIRALEWVLDLDFGLYDSSNPLKILVLMWSLSPMVGAYVLNSALEWNLSLMPMLVVGGVSNVIAVLFLCLLAFYMNMSQNQKNQSDNSNCTVATSARNGHLRNGTFRTQPSSNNKDFLDFAPLPGV